MTFLPMLEPFHFNRRITRIIAFLGLICAALAAMLFVLSLDVAGMNQPFSSPVNLGSMAFLALSSFPFLAGLLSDTTIPRFMGYLAAATGPIAAAVGLYLIISDPGDLVIWVWPFLLGLSLLVVFADAEFQSRELS